MQDFILEKQLPFPKGATIIRNTAANGDDYYMGVDESLVIIYNTSSYTQNVFLPPAAECPGKTVTILTPDAGGGGTIADLDDSLSTWTDLTNNADNEFAVIYSTGVGWVTLITTM